MKLIATPASPYSRKVRIVLAEKRIDYDFLIDSPGEAATRVPEFNPLGRFPCWCSMTILRWVFSTCASPI